ncbi:DUF1656 domain-containing protein [Rhodopila globiformis]|uniref:DUF1656 domain-containing protein n=1 Tax=Rhodopila globiformis TaxID=1071 RepID=A0A2S6NK21_RHOGL|nr:DUF1656 domain-containing protein [Rhodopila globiformis]PPQ35307.1 hypothetical protein CCS01_08160 [Rhodopila globiformis]
MRTEIDLFGVFIPGLLGCLVVALPVNAVLRRTLARIGLYRFVWHRALFDLALFVMVSGGVVWLSARVGWL